jgi:hypothetical protein
MLDFWPAYDCLIDVRAAVVTPELLSRIVPICFLTRVQEISQCRFDSLTISLRLVFL